MFNPAPWTGRFLELEGILQDQEEFMAHRQGSESLRSGAGGLFGNSLSGSQGNKSETEAVLKPAHLGWNNREQRKPGCTFGLGCSEFLQLHTQGEPSLQLRLQTAPGSPWHISLMVSHLQTLCSQAGLVCFCFVGAIEEVYLFMPLFSFFFLFFLPPLKL